MDPIYSLSGFVVGGIVGLTGVGGGSLMTPLLVLLFGVPPATAVGTDLLYAAITKAGGSVSHGRQGHVDWKIAGLLAAGSLPAAIVTVLVLSRFPIHGSGVTGAVTVALGVALILTAAAILFRGRLVDFAARHENAAYRRHLVPLTVAVGLVIGVLVSISSVGAGALGTAALFFLFPRLPTLRIVGTDIAHAVPLTLVAGIGHWWLGTVDWALLGSLLVGSLPGIWLGSRLAARLPDSLLRSLLSVLLVLVGSKLIAH
jgi:hypothetical protein